MQGFVFNFLIVLSYLVPLIYTNSAKFLAHTFVSMFSVCSHKRFWYSDLIDAVLFSFLPTLLSVKERKGYISIFPFNYCQAEEADFTADLHGNWKVETAKSRLHQFLQQSKIQADYKYTIVGPDHNRWVPIVILLLRRSRNLNYL